MNIWLAIANPNAGFRSSGRKWNSIRRALKDNDISIVPIITTCPNETIARTLEGIKKGFRRIIVIGGDGTLNEVINAIFQSGIDTNDFIVATIPTGAGNDWSRMHKIPTNIDKAIKIIKKEKYLAHDVGRIDYRVEGKQESRYYLINVGFGYDAAVVARINQRSHNIITGPLNYLLTVFVTLFKYKNHKVKVRFDGGTIYDMEGVSVNVAICKYKGAGMLLMPYAIPDDGLFDFTMIRKIGRRKLLYNLNKIYNGAIVKLPEIFSRQAEKVEIFSDETLVMETDGETIFGDGPYVTNIHSKAVKMIVA